MRALHRHGLLGEVHLAAAAFAALLASGAFGHEGRGIDVLGALAAAGASAPLLLRTRYPVPVLALTTAGIFTTLETLKATEAVALAPMIALYTVAATGPRERAFRAAGAMAVVAVVALALHSPHPVLHEETLKNLAFVALPVALGVGVRDRRLYIAAIHERAERAEATREEEARHRVEQERLRIAREVHDVVAHAMVAINVQAGVAAHLLDRDAAQAREALLHIRRTSGDALTDLRATLGVLREPHQEAPVEPAAGLGDLDALAARLRAAGVEVVLDVDAEALAAVPAPVHAAGHRIVQEALTNVLRHARAQAARVVVRAGEEALTIVVADDGRGGHTATGGSGAGVRGMRERAEALGGSLRSGPSGDGGWRVEAVLPLTPARMGP